MFSNNVRNARRLTVEILLLSGEKDIAKNVKAGEIGIWVYGKLAKTDEHLVNVYRDKVMFLPGYTSKDCSTPQKTQQDEYVSSLLGKPAAISTSAC